MQLQQHAKGEISFIKLSTEWSISEMFDKEEYVLSNVTWLIFKVKQKLYFHRENVLINKDQAMPFYLSSYASSTSFHTVQLSF